MHFKTSSMQDREGKITDETWEMLNPPSTLDTRIHITLGNGGKLQKRRLQHKRKTVRSTIGGVCEWSRFLS
jgi:hypothetical protein